jgi:hypothetical protein
MAAALFTTLQADVLPTDDRTSNIFSMLENSTRDGYVLLWHMFTLVVPVFDPSHRVDVPDWFEENQCVFQFAQAFLLYFRMQHKRKELVTLRDKSILFLRGIAADHAMVTSLLTMVLSSHHVPAGSLPHDLLIPQLATTISNSLDAAGRNRHTPRRANKTIESPPRTTTLMLLNPIIAQRYFRAPRLITSANVMPVVLLVGNEMIMARNEDEEMHQTVEAVVAEVRVTAIGSLLVQGILSSSAMLVTFLAIKQHSAVLSVKLCFTWCTSVTTKITVLNSPKNGSSTKHLVPRRSCMNSFTNMMSPPKLLLTTWIGRVF